MTQTQRKIKDFVQVLNEILEANFQNEDFGVSELATELGMSRSNLHRNMDTATKIPANQYIRQFRLQKGMEMLKKSSHRISEVAYNTGFNSPAYFIKCFGDYYGYAPGKVEASVEKEKVIVHEKSVLVLPFENMSSDEDQEYFCDGLTEEIISDLSHVNDLLVISRRSAMAFKGTTKNIKEIVGEIKVRYVLEGSVRKSGNNLRISAQLIDAEKDAYLWTEKYNGLLDDVFDIQENVSRSIVDTLKIKLSSGANKQITNTPVDNVHAFEWYLKARKKMQYPNEQSFNEALIFLQKGLNIIGQNSAIYAAMGTVYCNYLEFGINYSKEIIIKAEEYAFMALKLSPNSSFIYSLLGRIERFNGNTIKAIKYFNQALEIDPNDAEALGWAGLVYGADLGKHEIGIPLLNKLIVQDPLSPFNYLVLGRSYLNSLDYDKAIESFNKMLILDPGNVLAIFWSAYVYFWNNQYEKAFTLIDQLKELESDTPMFKLFGGWLLFIRHALSRDKKKALPFITKEIKEYFWIDPDLTVIGAGGYAIIDEKDESLRWLEHSIEKGVINYPLYTKNDPFLKNIRKEPRFNELMEKVKIEWDNLKV